LLEGSRHLTGHSHTRGETGADTGQATLVRSGDGDRLSGFVLCVLRHVTNHVHADAFVEKLLQLFGQAEVFDDQGVQRETQRGKVGLQGRHHGLTDFDLIGSHIKEGDTGLREGVRDVGHNHVAQLAFDFGGAIDIPGSGNLGMKSSRFGDVPRVDSETTQPHHAEILVADCDGLGGTPFLIGLSARGEEIDITLERRLEHFVPIAQVREDGKVLGVESVETRAENIGNLTFVDEGGHLALTHRELSTVLNLHVLHGIAVAQDAILRLDVLYYVNKLLGGKTLEIVKNTQWGASWASLIITKIRKKCSLDHSVPSMVLLMESMNNLRFLSIFLAALVVSGQMTTDQKIADLNAIGQFYTRHYTPAKWKLFQFGFDLNNLRPWLDRARATRNDLEYFDLVIDYLASLKDGHVRYSIPSNFSAYLQFDVDLYDGKATIDFISQQFPRRDFAIAIGDELVSLDGLTPEQWIPRLTKYGEGANSKATRRRAADFITFRPQASIPWAHEIGETARVVLRKQDGETVTYDIPWRKQGQAVTKLPAVLGPRTAGRIGLDLLRPERLEKAAARSAQWGLSSNALLRPEPEALSEYEQLMRSHQQAEAHPVDRALLPLGQPTPLYVPPPGFRLRLGQAASDQFLSGTFPLDGRTVGWIRLPTFNPSNQTLALTQFRSEIAALEATTSALVIDVMHNPGGNVCYAQELLRYLMPQNFWGVGYWIKPTAVWRQFFEARQLNAQNLPANSWNRVAVNEYWRLFEAAYENSEETGVYPICSDSLMATPQDVLYTKPVMLLTNEFSVSAADTFPALFQDARRGPVVGIRTGGLGGNVNDYFVTGSAEASLRITRSLIVRENSRDSEAGPTRFLENVGVKPDVELDIMTTENLLNGGRTFVEGWMNELRKLLAP